MIFFLNVYQPADEAGVVGPVTKSGFFKCLFVQSICLKKRGCFFQKYFCEKFMFKEMDFGNVHNPADQVYE